MKFVTALIVATLTAAQMVSAHEPAYQASQDYSNTTVKNETGGSMGLINIRDQNGGKVGQIFITGKTASFGSDGHICKGSGFVQAEPGQYVPIVFTVSHIDKKKHRRQYTQIMIAAKRVEWDGEGKTVDVRGVEPILTTMSGKKLKIVSNVDRPKVRNGMFTLTLKGNGTVTLRLKFEQGDKVPEAQAEKFF